LFSSSGEMAKFQDELKLKRASVSISVSNARSLSTPTSVSAWPGV
jgi:hypothetical protein